MGGRLKQKLQEAVKKLSYRTTVDQLKKKGIQKVNVVGLDRIAALIETAVHRTLRQKMAGMQNPSGGAGEIALATKDEFLKLLRNNQDLERAHQEAVQEKSNLESEVGKLRRELESVQSKIKAARERMEREERVLSAEKDSVLLEELESLLEKLESKDGDDEPKRAVMKLVVDRLEVERRRAVEARMREHNLEVEKLTRRLHKVNRALADTEMELEQVRMARTEDPGIASIYREVQGLDRSDPSYGKKRELMVSIFEANRKLLEE